MDTLIKVSIGLIAFFYAVLYLLNVKWSKILNEKLASYTILVVFISGCGYIVYKNSLTFIHNKNIETARLGNIENVKEVKDIAKELNPKSNLKNLEDRLSKIYNSYREERSVDIRYNKYCLQDSGMLDIMKKYYKNRLSDVSESNWNKRINTGTFKITQFSRDLNKVVAYLSDNGTNTMVLFRNTNGDYRIDWIYSLLDETLNEEYHCDRGSLFNNKDYVEANIYDLENVPERYKDKVVLLKNIKLEGFSNTWVDNLPGVTISSNGIVSTINVKAKEKWIGLRIKENKKYSTYYKCFTLKDNYDILKKYADNDWVRLNLKCQLVQLENTGGEYGLVVTDYEFFNEPVFKDGEAISPESL